MEHRLLFAILGLLSLIAALIYLRTFLSIMPSLVACVLRARENINLEESASLARERNAAYAVLMTPAIIVIAWYNLWCIEFFDGWLPEFRFLITIGIVSAGMGLKVLLAHVMEPRGVNRKLYNAVKNSFRNFGIITTLICLATIGTMTLFKADYDSIRRVTLCIAGTVYIIYMLRKLQIFASFRDIFSSILYLCALELLPTGILIAAAILF